jgi:predicted GNAT superfamily acetyltransferase
LVFLARLPTRSGVAVRILADGKIPKVSETAFSKQRSTIAVRPIAAVEEMKLGVELQKQIWGYSPLDTVPEQLFVVAQESGGHVLVAFDGDKPVGFALAYAGVHHGKAHLHSHMVGVIPEYQNRGVGRILKLAQRDDAIARGIHLIEWTFDPLQIKNAFFNISRLGGIIRRYIPNCYGRTSSPLHGGLPTDRLVAEWWVASPRVAAILKGAAPQISAGAVRISMPASIRQLVADDPATAESIQTTVREQFEQNFRDRRAAVAFEFDTLQANYVLEPYED